MFKYTKIGVNIISIVISISIFIFIDLLIFNQNFAFQSNLNSNVIKENELNSSMREDDDIHNTVIQEGNYAQVSGKNVEITIKKTDENVIEESKEEQENTQNKSENTNNWQIKIPKISLDAEIQEGTTKEIMNSFVGHFEETSKTEGNIGLAAHNRGYPKNYFQNLKKLNEGDEIIYKYGQFEKIYIVEVHKIIEDVDWSYLEQKEENTITLITCVENEPKYRRCIQAVEKIND